MQRGGFKAGALFIFAMIFGALVMAVSYMAIKHMLGNGYSKDGEQSDLAKDPANKLPESKASESEASESEASEEVEEPRTMTPEVSAKVSELLADRAALKQAVQGCWHAVGGEEGGLNIEGLRKLCDQVEESLGVPACAFGNLHDTYMRFDFNGDGTWEFQEAYMCVKHCFIEFRKRCGVAPTPQVPFKTPEEGGYALIRVLAHGGQGEASLVLKSGRKRKGTLRLVRSGSRGRAGSVCSMDGEECVEEEVVLKTYSRENENAGGLEELLDEAEHMRDVGNHPNLAHCYEIFQDDTSLYMVSGANFGGDWTSVRETAAEQGVALTEDWYRILFTQAFQGLAHLHTHAVMHCDIKEGNLMCKNKDLSNLHVVIIDFGMSQALFHVDEHGACGTPGYMPPETWAKSKWFPRGDIFSMGVVCAQLLLDKVPNPKRWNHTHGIFTEHCRDLDQIAQATQERKVSLHRAKPQSPALVDLIGSCLAKSIDERPRALQVLSTPWCQEGSPSAQETLESIG